MNLLLLEDDELRADDEAEVEGARAEHIRKILKLGVGDELRAGRADGPLGRATVTAIEPGRAKLRVRWEPERTLPPPSPVTLALALPRSPTMAKVLQQATAMGVKRFCFFHARRVEKSFWKAQALGPAEVRAHLRLGLEQSLDTRYPRVEFVDRFRPFAEDWLGAEPALGEVLVADPRAAETLGASKGAPRVLVLGPEGGFVDFELELFASRGFRSVGLGPRILRVETACVAALARLDA